jgi:TonB-dependent receptor
LALCGTLCLVSLHAQPAPRPAAPAPQTAEARPGSLHGIVSNAATNNTLEGARVAIPAVGREVTTDSSGSYSLSGLPAGSHEVVVSYIGLDTQRATVDVEPDKGASRDFALTVEIYKMETFRVTGEREGHALAITMQRNATNVKDVAALDSFGTMPNLSAGEVVMRLPGVAGNVDEDGNVSSVTVRGMSANLNRFTIDDSLIAPTGGMNRTFQTHNFSGAMFEQIEVIKGHTPDKGADSLGGTINMKTRSPLSMREKRRIDFNLNARWSPSFFENVEWREQHRLHPMLNATWQEIFSVAGGKRNLGVSLNFFYSENASSFFKTTRDYENTKETPAFLWDYRTADFYNNRQQYSINLKAEFKLTERSRFYLNTIYNDGRERNAPTYSVRAWAGNADSTPNDTNSGVVPGYTDTVTEIRPTSGSIIEVTNSIGGAINRTRAIEFGGSHELARVKLDYAVGYNQMHLNLANVGSLLSRIAGAGWILDRSESDLYPKFTQTAGPDMTDPSNYRPRPTDGLSTVNNKRQAEIYELRSNALYNLPVSFPLFIKAGVQRRQEKVKEINGQRRWQYLGTEALPAVPHFDSWDYRKTGRDIPFWDVGALMEDGNPKDPSLWKEDLYYGEEQKYVATRQVTETVTAGYGMIQGKYGRTGFLAGIRTEKTEDKSWGYVRAHYGSTSAEREEDPVGSAKKDYADMRREIRGAYTQSFPSLHLMYDFTPKLKGRASWSTSFGRPALNNLVPSETYNTVEETLTISNPGLKPQNSTNWDFTLNYYLKSVGTVSAGWFHKTITDFIVTNIESGTVPDGPDNGYNGDYAGYRILTSANAGTAYCQGWELSYQQQFTFLPGLLRGLGFLANYTVMDTHGDFGQATYLTTGEVVGFIPRTGNIRLSWSYNRFSMSVSANYMGSFISNYSRSDLGRNLYRKGRTVVSLGCSYRLKPYATLTLDFGNITDEWFETYRGIPSQMERTAINGITINVGVRGRF